MNLFTIFRQDLVWLLFVHQEVFRVFICLQFTLHTSLYFFALQVHAIFVSSLHPFIFLASIPQTSNITRAKLFCLRDVSVCVHTPYRAAHARRRHGAKTSNMVHVHQQPLHHLIDICSSRKRTTLTGVDQYASVCS